MCGVLRLRRPRDFEDKSGLPGLDDDPKGQERAALALQVDEAGELRQNLRGRLEAVYVAVRQRREVEERAADEIEDRRATLAHFGFRERACDRQVHFRSVTGRSTSAPDPDQPSRTRAFIAISFGLVPPACDIQSVTFFNDTLC
jgi:hypothetical protein